MKNLKDSKTKIYPSKTRGGKELPSSSALDSPSIMSKLATPPPHAINSDMLQVIDDATSTMNDAYDDASTLLDNDDVPLGEYFLMNKLLEYNMMLLNLMMSLKLKLLKHLLELAFLDMNCLKYWKVML